MVEVAASSSKYVQVLRGEHGEHIKPAQERDGAVEADTVPRPAIQGQRLRLAGPGVERRILLRAPPRHRPCAHATIDAHATIAATTAIADAASSSVRVIVCVGFLVARLRRGPLLAL